MNHWLGSKRPGTVVSTAVCPICTCHYNTTATSNRPQWEIPVGVQLVPGILLLLGTLFVPEAPRFLVDTEKDDKAQDALAWLRKLPRDDPVIVDELKELQETAPGSDGQAESPSLLSIVKQPSIRKRLGVGVGLMIAQNMVGLNALNYCKLVPLGLPDTIILTN